ncbi:hypothetical protein SAMN05216371_0092 [Streptomyces sp. TLI_053]|nr:hypothetical protein SAMN05216371_0092 [Streptomyces sp. TLI_053]
MFEVVLTGRTRAAYPLPGSALWTGTVLTTTRSASAGRSGCSRRSTPVFRSRATSLYGVLGTVGVTICAALPPVGPAYAAAPTVLYTSLSGSGGTCSLIVGQRAVRSAGGVGHRGVQPPLRDRPDLHDLPHQRRHTGQQHPVAPQPPHRLVEQRHRPLGVSRPARAGRCGTAGLTPRPRTGGSRRRPGSPRRARTPSSAARCTASPPRGPSRPGARPRTRPPTTARPAGPPGRAPGSRPCTSAARSPDGCDHLAVSRSAAGPRHRGRRTSRSPGASALQRTVRTPRPAQLQGRDSRWACSR